MASFSEKAAAAPLSFIFGSRAVIETILAGQAIEKVFFQTNIKTARSKALYNLVRKHEIPFSYVPVEKLDRMARGNHQGVVAVVSPIAFTPLDVVVQATFEKGKAPLLVVLDGVTDVHNIGAIARTALCMDVDALVLPTQGSAALAGAAMKTSAGALATLPICRVADLSKALRYLQESELTILACHAQAAQLLYKVDLKLPIALIVGGEDTGIAVKHLRQATHHICIPMQGPIASFNVSVAAGIILYEVFRQRFV
ncbi:MAG: 23S rRNA (guanosine(2251)-2'-O)-methyltransferase RlmB [Candidatus Cardinium sp.]|uniref:23S rRNA (guanosine(2251)-2'-O)-methyltransferase RlmB n=1 Tax=Cardinium endosymbiont of Dermatophagoides farinae TaxID=2597823 RepID=UPI001181FA1A|nr:23S rRNA (guanosine(2251)-2'-O)-methyltransferase RlmB [Cardinium endosymbiont of Dermatophagoides farinae]TSJ80527.1 23S rRNA (guanosine(2251)-2'-O)-methyltransferase RlmB [Cardinium endosymbiont of Dermatophagoides farinae]UWW96499.1 MAG: 23S rRNA (guanosine(2251)-2'-O)-methyltransferase RlmB [Candidatus Cardinium sp.]